ncbi:MAG TPA: hypothetical protein VHC86_15185 [Opitutaceae bacterium]|nr:hypothetical protein [Opitutaceae bacterium]
MTAADMARLRRSLALPGAAGAIVLAAAALLDFLIPRAAIPAYRFALFACLQPALGSLIFRLIHRITRGQWGEALGPFLDAGVRLVPWIWLLAIPLVFSPAARPPQSGPLPPGTGAWALFLKALLYEAIFLLLRRVALRESLHRWAAPGLILLVLTLHVLAADWFFTLDPGWYSTAFPIVWMSVMAVAGLALAVALAPAGGCDPSRPGSAGRPLGQDFGNLLMTAVIFSTYLCFMQFLIIWMGDIAREISWFQRRDAWGWEALVGALALFHLGLPLALLLSRGLKSSRLGVARVGAVLCAAQIGWAAWFILPAFAGRGVWLPPLSALFLAGGAGLFLNRYAAAANAAVIRT